MENHISSEHKKPVGVLFILLLAILILFLAVLTWNAFSTHQYIGKSDTQLYTITISGEGGVTATPDITQVSLGYQTEDQDVAKAQQDNTEKMNKLINQLKDLDIDKEDIKTTNYSIYPRYDYINRQQTLRGYQVSQNVSVKIRDLDKIGEVLSLAGSAGANQVSGLSFTIDDPEDLRQQAREEALANAKEKAEALAKVAGVKLGRLVSFNESGGGYDYPMPMFAEAKAMDIGIGGAAPDIEPGSQDITVNVTVTYEVL
tara:strand:- start:4649 stop:5422 length:774 start_codon:yes stop_codon:yes gene_type:complete